MSDLLNAGPVATECRGSTLGSRQQVELEIRGFHTIKGRRSGLLGWTSSCAPRNPSSLMVWKPRKTSSLRARDPRGCFPQVRRRPCLHDPRVDPRPRREKSRNRSCIPGVAHGRSPSCARCVQNPRLFSKSSTSSCEVMTPSLRVCRSPKQLFPVVEPDGNNTAATEVGDVRIERAGNQRWIVVKRSPS